MNPNYTYFKVFAIIVSPVLLYTLLWKVQMPIIYTAITFASLFGYMSRLSLITNEKINRKEILDDFTDKIVIYTLPSMIIISMMWNYYDISSVLSFILMMYQFADMYDHNNKDYSKIMDHGVQ